MINAPQAVIDALNSDNFSYANLITVNLGDAYGTGDDVYLYMTDYAHQITFGGNIYTPNNYLTEIEGITRKATTGSDSVEVVFSINDPVLVAAINARRYINKKTSIDRVIMVDGNVLEDYSIPIRSAWGLNHTVSGDSGKQVVTLVIDSVLGDLDGDNGWYAVNSSHQQRYPDDLIMQYGNTVMTEDQQKKYTSDYSGEISQQIKPPAVPKIYGYKDVELVPIAMLKHRKTHTSYRHYFTTIIYCISIGEVEHCDSVNLRKNDELGQIKIMTRIEDVDPDIPDHWFDDATNYDVGGTSAVIRTPADAEESSIQFDENLNFWREGMNDNEKAELANMFGKGLTLLFYKNRNRDDWISSPPKLNMPVKGAKVYDPRSGLAEYSRNPALQYADYLRSTMYGAGKRGIEVKDENIAELADHFDQIPDSIGTDGIDSILIDVQIDTGNTITDNMNVWMEGCRLYTSDYYGEFNIRVETKSATVLSINESELLSAPEYDAGEFTERINQLTYSIDQLVPDEAEDATSNGLVSVSVDATFPPDNTLTHAQWLEEDGGIANFESEKLDNVSELEQAYYWTMVDARISRKPQTLEMVVGSIGWLLEIGDVIDFSSDILGMDKELWRISEVAEDEGETELSLVAYDDEFYTPDPNAIPDPIPFARPTADTILNQVGGIEVVVKSGLYYLTWGVDSSENIKWYAVAVTFGGSEFLSNPRVSQPPLLLPITEIGNYQVVMSAASETEESEDTIFDFVIASPVAPTVNVIAGALDAQVIVSSETNAAGETFELEVGTEDNQNLATNYGTGRSFFVGSLNSGTAYYYWVRAISPIGESVWTNGLFTTTSDGSNITDLIGEDIANQILPDVIEAVEGDLQTVVDESLLDYSTTVETDALIDAALEEAGLAENEDNRITIVDQLNSIFDNNDSNAEIINVRTVVANESETRALEYTQLKADDAAIIKDLNLVATDVDGNTQAISSIEGEINNPDTGLSASYQLAQKAESDAIGNAESLTLIENKVNDEDTGLDAAFSLAGEAKSTADGASESTAILAAKVNDPTNGLDATFALAGQAKTTADGNTSAIGTLSTDVSDAAGDASSALTLASELDTSLDGYRASAQLKVDADGNVGLIQLDATPTVSQIKFQADQLYMLDSGGAPKVYWDNASSTYVFEGEIRAESGYFKGTIYANDVYGAVETVGIGETLLSNLETSKNIAKHTDADRNDDRVMTSGEAFSSSTFGVYYINTGLIAENWYELKELYTVTAARGGSWLATTNASDYSKSFVGIEATLVPVSKTDDLFYNDAELWIRIHILSRYAESTSTSSIKWKIHELLLGQDKL